MSCLVHPGSDHFWRIFNGATGEPMARLCGKAYRVAELVEDGYRVATVLSVHFWKTEGHQHGTLWHGSAVLDGRDLVSTFHNYPTLGAMLEAQLAFLAERFGPDEVRFSWREDSFT